MKKHLFLFFITLLFSSICLGQDTTPTPTPSVTPTPEVKNVDDKQEVAPENLKGVPPIAPKYQSDDRSLPDLGRVGVDMLEQKPLSLNDAIKMALENNKDIEVQRQTVKSVEFDLQAADGAYSPRLFGQSYYERATTPNLSIFSSNKTITNNSEVGNITYQGFRKKFGTTYSFSLNTTRLTTNNSISLLNPQYNTGFNFSLTQPLRRGFKIDQTRRVIEIAKKNLSLTDTQFRQKSIEIITTTQRAYWDLTFALRNLQVQRDGVKDAKDQLAHNQRLVNEGQLAPIDIVAAETQVANLELAVYDALETVNRAENILKNLIAVDKNDSLWNVAILPTDKIDLDIPNTTLPEALNLAMQNRPEIEINNTAKEINSIDRTFLKDQTKSQVDLTASYTTSGLSGSFNSGFKLPFQPSACTTQPVDPVACQAAITAQTTAIQTSAQTFSGGIQSNFTDLVLNRYPTFRVGITFNIPIKNQTAEANLGKNLVEKEKLETQRQQLEQGIQVDVRNALQSLRTAEARLRAAAIARENSQKQYESEQRKLDAGQSDVYKVLERQTALMNAKSNELRSQTELNKAIAELQRATGNSLKANNVESRLRK
jgi:HAE1 family hydrophobic/amphiphilic exporter-1